MHPAAVAIKHPKDLIIKPETRGFVLFAENLHMHQDSKKKAVESIKVSVIYLHLLIVLRDTK